MLIFLLVIIALACLEDAIVVIAGLVTFFAVLVWRIGQGAVVLLLLHTVFAGISGRPTVFDGFERNRAQPIQRWTPVQSCERSRGVVQCPPRRPAPAPTQATRGTRYAYTDPRPHA